MSVDLADKYWDLGNAITGFSIVQMILFLSALANREFRGHVVKRFPLVVAASLCCSAMYALAVWFCYNAETTLRTALHTEEVIILRETFWARIIAIAIAGGFGTGLLVYGRRHRWGA
jgi:multidrug efflux pump subunit AcrB